jgi:hypothetical protein
MQERKLTDFELSGQRIELFFDDEEEVGMRINKGKFNAWLDHDGRLDYIFPVMPDENGEPEPDQTGKYTIQDYWANVDWADKMTDLRAYLKYLETNEKLKP